MYRALKRSLTCVNCNRKKLKLEPPVKKPTPPKMDITEFQLDCNLQTISMVSFVTSLWDLPHIKTEIRNLFSEGKISKPRYKNWYGVTRKVLDCLNTSQLPPKITVKLQSLIVFIGEKIFDWIHHVLKTLKLDFKYAEKIYFTSYGTIDEIRIYESSWRKIMSEDEVKSEYFSHSPIFSLACMYNLQRVVDEIKGEVTLPQINKIVSASEGEIYKNMTLSLYSTIEKNKMARLVSDFYLEYNMERNANAEEVMIQPIEMLKMCLDAGYNRAVYYYWNRLNEIDRVVNLENLAEKCLKRQSKNDDLDMFTQEKFCELFLFFINQLEEEQRLKLLTRNANKIVSTFLNVWPYQDLSFIFSLFDQDWGETISSTCESLVHIFAETRGRHRELERSSSKFKPLLHFIVESKGRHNEADCPIEKNIYFQLLQRLWAKIPNIIKYSICSSSTDVLFLNFDIPTLNLILSDEEIQFFGKDVRSQIAYSGCKELATQGRFDLIDRLIDEVLHSDAVKKEIKQSYVRTLETLIQNDDFETADKFLNWISDSPAERSEMKSRINSVEICQDLTESSKYQLAEKYLTWQFETESEIQNFKETMKSSDFIPKIIYKIWREKSKADKSFKKVYIICEEFIRFYFQSDEEIVEFKKNKFNFTENENFVEFLYENIFKDHPYSKFVIMENFFKFCMVDSENIESIKQKMRNDIEKWIDSYAVDRHNIELAEFLINWLYVSKERKEIIKKYLNSSNKGALFCKTYLGRINENYRYLDSELVKLAYWLIMVNDIDKMKNDLRRIEENVPEWFLFFLDKLISRDVLAAVAAVRRVHFGIPF